MKYSRWTQDSGIDNEESPKAGYLRITLQNLDTWSLMSGQRIEKWGSENKCFFENDDESFTDFPFTNNDLPIYSQRLRYVVERFARDDVQYLPITIANSKNGQAFTDYYLANYLRVIDCIDKNKSDYQIWTKENLLFWEKRPYKLGTFRDLTRPVLDLSKVKGASLFRVLGWEEMVVVREDVKQAIETAQITGCLFSELETV